MTPLWLWELGLGLGLGCLAHRGEALVGIIAGEWMRKPNPQSNSNLNPNSPWLLHHAASSSSTPVADEVSFLSCSSIGYVRVGGRVSAQAEYVRIPVPAEGVRSNIPWT